MKENGLDGTITIIRGKVEEVTLPVDQVCVVSTLYWDCTPVLVCFL